MSSIIGLDHMKGSCVHCRQCPQPPPDLPKQSPTAQQYPQLSQHISPIRPHTVHWQSGSGNTHTCNYNDIYYIVLLSGVTEK